MILNKKSLFKGIGAAIILFGGVGFVVNAVHFSSIVNVNLPFNIGLILTGSLLFYVVKKFLSE